MTDNGVVFGREAPQFEVQRGPVRAEAVGGWDLRAWPTRAPPRQRPSRGATAQLHARGAGGGVWGGALQGPLTAARVDGGARARGNGPARGGPCRLVGRAPKWPAPPSTGGGSPPPVRWALAESPPRRVWRANRDAWAGPVGP